MRRIAQMVHQSTTIVSDIQFRDGNWGTAEMQRGSSDLRLVVSVEQIDRCCEVNAELQTESGGFDLVVSVVRIGNHSDRHVRSAIGVWFHEEELDQQGSGPGIR